MVLNKKAVNMKAVYMILSVIIGSVAMSLVDGVLQPGYFVKSLIKIGLFLIVPLIYFFVNRSDVSDALLLFKPRLRDVVIALGLGAIVYGFIVGGYFLLRGIIDFSGIASSLGESAGVSANNFIYVSLYISFVNSFLEEFFFRGFAFVCLKKEKSRGFAYLFSSLMFALYHSGMTMGWFNIGIFALTLVGLMIAGIIFDFLNEKSGNIYTSWVVHMFANFGINTVGFILFGMI